ncbi:hypothetical protein PAXRUDRAFT_31249 [Paxillus rubicundulus Ve08.2h10]|uniref:TauD/TfdA-like domain-containing protein n=1 Tax=Paxillus rubicundulus Ve08.2h10 TaxID=930991 RepID=A0A0D0EBW5_9AGAM|nr:hypothetical protein PAXRUDRAFT_31249 [Paxillus rubicundulus Ve08.2h10]
MANTTFVIQDGPEEERKEETYKYAHLLSHFSRDTYPPFEHVDPGLRALKHADPRAFLKAATGVIELTPNLGTEICGIHLTALDTDGRDQLALEVTRRGLVVFRDQSDFINQTPEAYLEWGRHLVQLLVHPTSSHPKDYPQIHLVYKDAKSTFNFEIEDSITSIVWHSDVSYELRPSGLTTFFLLSQPTTGGDTLFTLEVSALKKLSPSFVAFLRTLSAVHPGVEQANFSQSGKRGGVVRREPVERVHPLVRRHPVTGEEALYVNKQFTKRIVGSKREESEAVLKFLYDHVDKSGDLRVRVKWEPGTSAIVDYGNSRQRRHGARITSQAERPIPASDSSVLPT